MLLSYRILFSVFLSLMPLSAYAEANLPPEEEVRVYAQGDTLYYSGYMDAEAIEKAKKLLPAAKLFVRDSKGGDVELGIFLGTAVHNADIDVKVVKECLSSCANYVFPAGRKKILGEHSLLGWHGGVSQGIDPEQPLSPMQKVMFNNYVQRVLPKEEAFFSLIGVQQVSTTYGQKPQFDRYKECVGWTYSVKAMQALGIKNIVLEAGTWTPPKQYEGKCVFTIDSIE
jgi:hypothetical protein